MDGEDEEVFGVAMHPSRDLLALGLVDGRALLYAYEGMGETCRLQAELRCAMRAPETKAKPGRRASSENLQPTNPFTHRHSSACSAHEAACRAVVFHPEGETAFTASSDKCVRGQSHANGIEW